MGCERFGKAEAGAAGVELGINAGVIDVNCDEGYAVGHMEREHGLFPVRSETAGGELKLAMRVVEGKEKAAEEFEAEETLACTIGVAEVVDSGMNVGEFDAGDF